MSNGPNSIEMQNRHIQDDENQNLNNHIFGIQKDLDLNDNNDKPNSVSNRKENKTQKQVVPEHLEQTGDIGNQTPIEEKAQINQEGSQHYSDISDLDSNLILDYSGRKAKTPKSGDKVPLFNNFNPQSSQGYLGFDYQCARSIYFIFFTDSNCVCSDVGHWSHNLQEQFNEANGQDSDTWIPTNLRSLGPTMGGKDDELKQLFYHKSSGIQIYSYVFYSLIILTLGNDIAPLTIQQSLLAVAVCVSGSFLTAIFFGQVAVLIAKLNADASAYQNKTDKIEAMLQINKIPKKMRQRSLQYMDYVWQKKRATQNIFDISMLSRDTQQEIQMNLHQEMIQQVPIFSYLQTNEIVWMINRLKSDVFLPEDYIVRKGEIGNTMYFIIDGFAKVVIVNEQNPSLKPIERKIVKGEFFGQLALLFNSKRTADVISIDFTTCEVLSKEDYEDLVYHFPMVDSKLQRGLKQYRYTFLETQARLLQQTLLKGIESQEQMKIVSDKYFEEIFLEPNQLILKPAQKTNALYMVLMGRVSEYQNNPDGIRHVKNVLFKENQRGIRLNLEVFSLDKIINMKKRQDDENERFEEEIGVFRPYNTGSVFGSLPIDGSDKTINSFFISSTGCQLCFISSQNLNLLKTEKPDIHRQIVQNYLHIMQRRDNAVSMLQNFGKKNFLNGRNSAPKLGKEVIKENSVQNDSSLASLEATEQNEDEEFIKNQIKFQNSQLDAFLMSIREKKYQRDLAKEAQNLNK